MIEGDILILKCDMFLDIPKYTKVTIYRCLTTINRCIIDIDNGAMKAMIQEKELSYFWKLAEYRQHKIKDLI